MVPILQRRFSDGEAAEAADASFAIRAAQYRAGDQNYLQGKGALSTVTQSTAGSATATTGKTVLALVAVLSLLLSLFAIASPALADHLPPDGPAVSAQTQPFPGGNPICPAGSTGVRYNNPSATGGSTITLADGSQATIAFTISADNKLTFVITGGLAVQVFVKGGANNTQNLYDYSGMGGIAHDDGLITPAQQGISHIDFCVIPVKASIIVYKTDQLGNDVAGAAFEVWDGDTKVAGPELTGADGIVCFDDLVLGKTYTVMETDAPDGWLPADPDSQEVVAAEGTCADRAGDDPDATFTNIRVGSLIVLKTDDSATAPTSLADAEFTVDGVTQTTGADGRTCFDNLVAGDLYDVTETTPPPGYEPADPATVEDVAAGAGTCAERAQDDPDVTFTNALTPGSLIVLKTDDNEQAPMSLAGAEFTVDGVTQTTGDDGRTCFDGLVAGDAYDVTETTPPPGYQPADPATIEDVVAGTGTCEDRAQDEPDVTFTNAPEELGSITINKEIDCEICDTFTPGHWFNQGGGGGTDFADDSLTADSITVAGITFASVADVQENSDPGSLLRHWLALQMNLRWGVDNECALGSLVYDGSIESLQGLTVQQISDMAEDVLNDEGPDAGTGSGASQLSKDLHDAIDEINNSGTGDGTLVCEGADDVSGFTFELFFEDETEPRDSGTTGDDGTLVFEDLELGTWTLVETSPEGMECEIVDVTVTSGDPESVTLNEDGTITIELTSENQDVVLTVVNDCEETPPPPGNGELEVIKFFCPTEGEDEIFVFGPLLPEPVDLRTLGAEEELPDTEGCTLGAPSEQALGATFTITGGDLTEPLVVVTTWDEILTLDLAPGSYEITEEGTGLSASFEIVEGGDTAVVVFNFEEGEQGNLKILKFFCVGEGDPVFTVVDGDATLGDVDLPDNCDSPEPGDATFTLTTGDSTSGEFTLGSDGARLIPLAVGTYVLNEVDPNEASSGEFDITADETTTAIVFDFEGEGTEGGNPPGGNTPGGNAPGEGTLGGTPDTAMDPATTTGTQTSALLALLAMSALGAAGFAARAEVRRRR